MRIADANGDRVYRAHPGVVFKDGGGSPCDQCVWYTQSDGVAIARPGKFHRRKCGAVARRDARYADVERLR